MWLYGWEWLYKREPRTVSQHPAKFDSHRDSDSGDITLLFCYMTKVSKEESEEENDKSEMTKPENGLKLRLEKKERGKTNCVSLDWKICNKRNVLWK